jgi:hypothetical protein
MVSGRSRLTRDLINRANQRLRGCEACWRRDAVRFADEVLGVLKLTYRESDRLFRKLTCPCCDSRIFSETLIVSTTSEGLRRFAGYRQFEARHGRDLKQLRNALTDRSRACLRRRLDFNVAREIRATKPILLDKPLTWYYARSTERGLCSKGGRYNGEGDETWYAAGDPETASVEALRGVTSGAVEIFEECLRRPFLVLDLREQPCGEYPFSNWFLRNTIALGYLSEPAPFGQSGEAEYRAPQLIAHWARQCGIHGILYTSTRHSPYGSPVGGDCLAIFNTDKATKGPSQGIFRFSEPSVDINFPEETWKLTRSRRECGI